MKPGYQTTEFWLTFAKMVLTVLVASGVVKAADSETLAGQITNAVTALGVVLANGYAVAQYARSRADVKSLAKK